MSEARAGRAAQGRVGTVINGKWQVDARIGSGGMATVYAATHRNGSRVALKMLHTQLSRDPSTRARFLREGYVANAVGHPAVVAVLDDGVTEDGAVFLVLELLEGESLDDRRIRLGGSLPLEEVLDWADAALDALVSAHEKGIIHRDVKPENVFITKEGQLKLLDFGLARMKNTGGETTKTGVTIGTPEFMPPEQAMGRRDADARSDLWGLGATLYTAITGRFVHEDAQSLHEQLIASATRRSRPIRQLAPHVPAGVAKVIDRALELEMDDRWPNAREMQSALREARGGRLLADRQVSDSMTTGVAIQAPALFAATDETLRIEEAPPPAPRRATPLLPSPNPPPHRPGFASVPPPPRSSERNSRPPPAGGPGLIRKAIITPSEAHETMKNAPKPSVPPPAPLPPLPSPNPALGRSPALRASAPDPQEINATLRSIGPEDNSKAKGPRTDRIFAPDPPTLASAQDPPHHRDRHRDRERFPVHDKTLGLVGAPPPPRSIPIGPAPPGFEEDGPTLAAPGNTHGSPHSFRASTPPPHHGHHHPSPQHQPAYPPAPGFLVTPQGPHGPGQDYGLAAHMASMQPPPHPDPSAQTRNRPTVMTRPQHGSARVIIFVALGLIVLCATMAAYVLWRSSSAPPP